MWHTLIVLLGGTQILSGPGAGPKVLSSHTTRVVNDGEELSIGSCCPALFECTLLNPGGELGIAAGDEFAVYRVRGEERRAVGLFTMEEPLRPTANRYKITAYDRISWLDKDLSDWVLGLEEWPYTVQTFAEMVCTECGLTLATKALMNGDYQIQRFAGSGITGRKLMQWVGQISGTFCRATPAGEIEFTWYGATNTTVGPADAFSVELADYQTATIDRVQIQLTRDDVGVIYPDVAGVTYPVTGNYLLSADDATKLEAVAESLYETLRSTTYTPGTVVMAHNPDICPGDIINVRDRNNKTATFYVMSKSTKGQRDTLQCTGSHSRESSTNIHKESFKAMKSAMFEIRKDVSGLSARATETELRVEDNRAYTDERAAEIILQAAGIAAAVQDVHESVEGVETRIAAIQETAESITLKVEKIVEEGVDKVKTGLGLTIDNSAVTIARPDAMVETKLDETGMYVTRTDGTIVLRARYSYEDGASGVDTQNLKVTGYLDKFGMLRQQSWVDEFGRPCVATLWTGG